MCGIAGLLLTPTCHGGEADRLLGHAERMPAATPFRSRGPDGLASHDVLGVNGSRVARLWSSRLAITDRLRAHTAMHSSDGAVSLVYNGEIYNFRELRRELECEFVFQTAGDTEVVLAAYLRWGTGMFEHLDGMYALCLVDARSTIAVLASDHAGQLPLYYFVPPSGAYCVFASDVDTVLSSGLVPFVLNVEALQEQCLERYIRDAETHIQGLARVVNGTFVALSLERPITPVPRRHFLLPTEPQFTSEAAACDEVYAALVSAHRSAVLDCEVEPCFLLSSGIDSTALVSLAKRSRGAVRTYTLGFYYDGVPWGENRAALEQLGVSTVNHTDVWLSEEQHIKLIDEWCATVPHLLYSRDATFLHALCKRVRNHGGRVVVTGCGADEIFDGYHYGRALATARARGGSLEEAHCRATLATGSFDVDAALCGRLTDVTERIVTKIRAITRLYDIKHSPVQVAQAINWHTRSQFECLKGDAAAMTCGLETRRPFYARALADIGLRVPGEWKRKDHVDKYVMRRAYVDKSLLPEHVAMRPKLGFPSPGGLHQHRVWGEVARLHLRRDNPLFSSGVLSFDVVSAYANERRRDDVFTEYIVTIAAIVKRQQTLVHDAECGPK